MQSALISKAPGWKRDGCGLWRAKFRLLALGHFELTGPDASVDVLNNKLAGLLAYLACTAPKQQPERKLATLLSGSHFDTQARQNLRQPLFQLRRVLGQKSLSAKEGDAPAVKTWLKVRPASAARELLQDQQLLALSAISNTLDRMAAAIAHSKQRNIDLSRMSSDKQEADAVQCRQRKPFEITILRPSAAITSIAPNASSPPNRRHHTFRLDRQGSQLVEPR